jgi:hypothetical protein
MVSGVTMVSLLAEASTWKKVVDVATDVEASRVAANIAGALAFVGTIAVISGLPSAIVTASVPPPLAIAGSALLVGCELMSVAVYRPATGFALSPPQM